MKFQGEKLKKVRLEKGLSLEEAQKKTKIHINILKAIEGDSITNLEPIYIKGFLKIYCKYLGVDFKECVSEEKEIKEPEKRAEKPKEAAVIKKEPARPKEVKPLLKVRKFNPDNFIAGIARFKTAFILILVIAVSSVILFNLGKFISSKQKELLARKRTPVSAAGKKEKRQEPKAEQVKTVTVIPAPVIPPPAALISPQGSAVSLIRLGIRARDNCWIQVKADGKVVFQRVLERGRFENWQAKNRIELSLGNAGGVELEVNGQIFSNLGRKGEVRKNIVITREGLNIGR